MLKKSKASSNLEDFEVQSQKAKELINKAKRILLSLHRHPDGDSVASCLAMYHYLLKLGKKIVLISPGEPPKNYDFLPNFAKIEIGKDFLDLDLGNFDLFIALDCASWEMFSENKEISQNPRGDWQVINIDHHKTNLDYGDLNIVNENIESTCGLLLDLFANWSVNLNPDLVLTLLAGIVADTGGFHYANTKAATLAKASVLVEKGADLKKLMFNFLRRTELEQLRYWQLALRNLEVDRSGRYVRIILPFGDLKQLDLSRSYSDETANFFLLIVEGTDFGYLLSEDEPGLINASLRARTDFDVSKMAQALGGGGHAGAAGFVLRDMNLKEAQEEVEKAIKRVI